MPMDDERWMQVGGFAGALAFCAMLVDKLFQFFRRNGNDRSTEIVAELRAANATLARIEAQDERRHELIRERLHDIANGIGRLPAEIDEFGRGRSKE